MSSTEESRASFDPRVWSSVLGDLRRTEAEMRLQLRTNGGHRGKVSQDMLIWLDDFKRRENQMEHVDRTRADGYKVVREVKSLLEKASSLLVSYGNNAIHRVAEQLVTPTLVGKSAQSILNQVCDYLADPNPEIAIIGLYGEGGVGKTTIMKNLNNLFMNTTDFFDKIIWVTMSQGATIQSVQDQIALQLGITLPPGQLDPLILGRTRASLISDYLNNLGRCLFLLDDMWNGSYIYVPNFLTGIGVSKQTTDTNFSYKVVLTTRSAPVCRQIGAHKTILVSPLSENEAWDLFVSRSSNHVFDPKIRNIAELIVYECKGLPIAVITIAHAMREEVSTLAWRRALEDIRSTDDKHKNSYAWRALLHQ